MIPLINRAPRGGFNGGVVEKSRHFLTTLANSFSSLHDDERPDEVLHQFHSIDLIIPLQMVVLMVFARPIILAVDTERYVTTVIHRVRQQQKRCAIAEELNRRWCVSVSTRTTEEV
jgi:hypothetical protein